MLYHGINILQYDGHEAKMDEIDISHKQVLLAVVNQELDVRRNPKRLYRGQIYAADPGAGIPVPN